MMKKSIMSIGMISFLFILSCGTTKKAGLSQEQMRERAEKSMVKKDSLDCDHSGILKLSDDDQCGILLQLPNKLLIQPISLPNPDFTFTDGQKVRVSYRIMEDMTTPCKSAFAAAEITCLEKDLHVSANTTTECQDVIDIFSVDWMKKALNEMDARRVAKGLFKEKPVYLFDNTTATVIFDCYGHELCREQVGQVKTCAEIRGQIDNEQVLLVVDY